jgi:FkbM family methyltransferase
MNKECFDGTTIKNFLNYVNINNRNEQFVIFDIGSRDCIQSIEFYYAFPNSIIYAFECNPNTIDICKKNIENYKDRIILIEGCVCDYNGTIKFHPINKEKTKLRGLMEIKVLHQCLKVMDNILMKCMYRMK